MMLRILKQYYPIRNVFFVIGEGLMIYLAVFTAVYIVRGYTDVFMNLQIALKVALFTFVCQTILYYNDLYNIKQVDSFGELTIRLLQGLGFTCIFLAIVYFVFPGTLIASGIFILAVGLVFLFIAGWRFWYMIILDRGMFNQNIILVGSGDLSKQITNEIKSRKDIGYKIVASIPIKIEKSASAGYEKDSQKTETSDQPQIGDLLRMANQNNVTSVIVALDEKRGCFPTQELLACRVKGIDVIEGNSFFEMLKGKLIVSQLSPSWLIFSKGFEKTFFEKLVKRALDTSLSLVLGILTAPLIALVMLLIKLDSKGPVIYSQERVGRHRKPVRIYKFRSMIQDAEKASGPQWAEEEDPRITRVGRIIRKLRIDEIPQLWNVIKGNMSMVGPRPERQFFVEQLEKTIPFYKERFTVKPGLTGWAQIRYAYGASEDDAEEKLNFDLFYIKNMSILFDLVIIFNTVKIVLFGTGAR